MPAYCAPVLPISPPNAGSLSFELAIAGPETSDKAEDSVVEKARKGTSRAARRAPFSNCLLPLRPLRTIVIPGIGTGRLPPRYMQIGSQRDTGACLGQSSINTRCSSTSSSRITATQPTPPGAAASASSQQQLPIAFPLSTGDQLYVGACSRGAPLEPSLQPGGDLIIPDSCCPTGPKATDN